MIPRQDRPSSVRVTVENVGIAFGSGIILSALVTFVLGLARLLFDALDGRPLRFLGALEIITSVPSLFICVGPIVFVPIFAVLQRKRLG
jgi:hypothetical protein